MTGAGSEGAPEGAGGDPTEDAVRRRRRQQVFGDVLPDTTADEREPGTERGESSDEWLRSNVPPHHG